MGAREVMSCLCDLDFLFERILCTLCVCVCVCVKFTWIDRIIY